MILAVVDCSLNETQNMAASGGTLVTERIIRTYEQCLSYCLRMVGFFNYLDYVTSCTLILGSDKKYRDRISGKVLFQGPRLQKE